MKFLITIFFVFILKSNSLAQSDSLAMFHQPSLATEQSKVGIYKNAVNFNLLQIIRGSALLSYERLIGKSGFAATAGVGICKFDAIGQIYLRELTQYYNSGGSVEVTKLGTKIRPLFELGLKYYIDDINGGSYFGLDFTSINNTVNIRYNYQSYTLPVNLRQLDYRSNDFKCMFGFANSNDKKFYHDASIGVGYRFINYEHLAIDNIVLNASNSSQALTKENSTNQTIWIFIAWKMGIRF